MKFQMVMETGDVVTVAKANPTGGKDVYRDVVVNSVPAADRFTFWNLGKLVEADVSEVIVRGAVHREPLAIVKEQAASDGAR